jgi:hypothetical protein
MPAKVDKNLPRAESWAISPVFICHLPTFAIKKDRRIRTPAARPCVCGTDATPAQK